MTKKLLFITPIFPKKIDEDHVVPFISQFTQNFSTAKNVEIHVISLMYPFSREDYKIGHIHVYAIGGKFKKTFHQIPFLIKAILKGRKLHKLNKYDGILCFWYRESALVGKILSTIIKVKLIVWMHGQDTKKENKYLKFLKIPANKIVMISALQKEFFLKNCNIDVEKIANVAIDIKRFPVLNEGERKIDVVGIGNLGDLKNYSLFIDIISELNINDLKVVIIGDGEEKEMLINKVSKLGLSKNISFSGVLTHNEVLTYLNNSQAFLHTSKFEGNSTVIQEALYSGCHVVSTIDIEKSENLDSFFYSSNKSDLVNRLLFILKNKIKAKRIEKFKMEDTINVIYNCFYNN
jgi:glycosyltransferase involved in cell wall biosynthesis